MFRYDTVELCVTSHAGRDTYLARVRHDDGYGATYVLTKDDGAAFDPVDGWRELDLDSGEAGEALGPDDECLGEVLNRAVRAADESRRPHPPLARLSEPLETVALDAELGDEDFNRLADEIAASCPGIDPALLHERALRLKAAESMDVWGPDAPLRVGRTRGTKRTR